MKTDLDRAVRRHVVDLLTQPHAHVTFEHAVRGLPVRLRGLRPTRAPHSAWELVEHLRLCQWDILEFCRDPKHVSPKFPHGLWPATIEPPTAAAWSQSIRALRSDLKAMTRLVTDRRRDLLARVNHPEATAKHTLLREALVLADHNAYHVGQLVMLRRQLEK